MKTFLRKAKLSAIAMCIGWAACNLTVCIVGAVFAWLSSTNVIAAVWAFGIFAIASGIVIAGAWLVIFLPVDLIVADGSRLRSPTTAAMAGLQCAVVFTIVHLGTVLSFNASFEFTEALLSELLSELLFTGVTGSVAAYARCRLEPSKSPNTPCHSHPVLGCKLRPLLQRAPMAVGAASSCAARIHPLQFLSGQAALPDD